MCQERPCRWNRAENTKKKKQSQSNIIKAVGRLFRLKEKNNAIEDRIIRYIKKHFQ